MNKAMLKGVSGGLILALFAALPVRANEEGQSEPYVVVVGVGDHQDKQILPRVHAEDDARALYDLLTNKDYLGADADHSRLLLSKVDPKRPSEVATHENIIQALQWVAEKAKRNDPVILALIGQGAPLNERACFLAADSTFKDRAKNAVASADIEKALEKLKSQHVCVFVDVNYKGYDAGKDPAPELNVQNFYQMKEFLGDEDSGPPIGRALFLATKGLTPSLDLEAHDLFTTVILDGLKGAADKDGYEPDGQVTVDELADYLEKDLPPLAGKDGKTKEEKEQASLFLENESSHFVLTHNPAVMPKVQERLSKLTELEKGQKISKDLEEEGDNLLGHMPKLEAYRSLRKDYQRLVDGDIGIDEFTKERKHIFSTMKMSRFSAREFAAKVIEATQMITTDYVKEVDEGELVGWGVQGLYQRIEEPMPQDIKDRVAKTKTLNEKDLTNLLTDVRERLGSREDLDNHKDLDYTLQRMTSHLDPYTTYYDPETWARFKQETSGTFSGIGIQIAKDTARDMLRVVTPIKDSPAYTAVPLNADVEKVGKGLKAGDIITEITRDEDAKGNPLDKPEAISTKGLPLSDAVKTIMGQPRSKVKLTIEREGVSKPLNFEITRGTVEVETVIGVKRKADDSWDYMVDPESKICYVRLTSFADNTYRDLVNALNDMRKQGGIKGLVLDLRFNPGGLLQSAVYISDTFIDDGLIVTIRDRQGHEDPHYGETERSLLDFPMVCLINGGSASASEIVSACLQDQKRAIIIGERSYGKGSVQNLQSFEGGKLKMTTASYWRPSGKNINRLPTSKETDEWGVTPDKIVKMARSEREDLAEYQRNQEVIPRRDLSSKEAVSEFKDKQMDAALEYLRGQIQTASRAPVRKAG